MNPAGEVDNASESIVETIQAGIEEIVAGVDDVACELPRDELLLDRRAILRIIRQNVTARQLSSTILCRKAIFSWIDSKVLEGSKSIKPN